MYLGASKQKYVAVSKMFDSTVVKFLNAVGAATLSSRGPVCRSLLAAVALSADKRSFAVFPPVQVDDSNYLSHPYKPCV
jgi:hypothetical protein